MTRRDDDKTRSRRPASSTPRRKTTAAPRRPASSTPRRKAVPTPRRDGRQRTSNPRDPRRRIVALLCLFCLIGIAFIYSLVDLQTVRADRFRDIGEEQRSRAVALAGYRGTLLDRDGAVLAASTPGQQLVVDPQKVVDPVATAAVLGPALGIDASLLIDPLTPASPQDRYGVLAESIDDIGLARYLDLTDDEQLDDVLNGISVVPIEERIYPAGDLARPVIGKMGDDQGIYGLEWQLDEALQGEAGVDRHERSVFGVISVGDRDVEPATPGDDVYLTIDQNIQYVVEEALIEHCEDTLANSAQAVVSDPRTGEILAMATVIRTEAGECIVPIYNAPLVISFEPGSVIKMVTAAAAVEELGWDSTTTFDVPNSIVVEDKEFFEHDEHPVAPYPVAQIVAQSMNVGTIMMGQAVGAEKLASYLGAFGFGQETELGWKDELTGVVRPYDEWYGSDIGSISIGQGMSATAVQLAMAYNTIANDGVYLGPKLVRSIVDDDGVEQAQPSQITRRVVSSETAAEVTKMLTAVVDPNGIGTGRAAAVPGYTVAGKTGTAWKVFEDENGVNGYGRPGNRRYVVTFAGFLPANDPQLSIVVVVDEPKTQTSAGLVAAPVFADVAHYVVRILGIAPEHDALVPGELVRGTPAPASEEPSTEPPMDQAPELEVETLEVAAVEQADAAGESSAQG